MRDKLLIGLGTYKRPLMLEKALTSLQDLKFPDFYDVFLLVCDNDANGSSRETVERINLSFEVYYKIEPRQGIVNMRNAILNFANNEGFDLLTFFDDDEVVSPQWLVEIVSCMQFYGVEAVHGHVDFIFPETSRSPFVKKYYPGMLKKQTGDDLKVAYTNNVLINLEFVRTNNLTFNPKFNLTGGSDTLFFRTLKDLGGKIVYCREALVSEFVPETRTSIEWLLTRHYRNGYVSYLIQKERTVKVYRIITEIMIVIKFWIMKMKLPLHIQDINTYKRFKRIKNRRKTLGRYHALKQIPFEEYTEIHGE
ncbi:MAG: hypothetical protein CMB80_31680 [Flammeovirgaceae bacterium]|nr:hypothetical protein [Flammeovirgaceae bacterium]MBE62385.1 hypothetical protein [Flammeovirgaceae bacterium]|tara:strand:- start:310 stop:1233 length:924 start_codon:yes stop_codon:yes gene_type:complete